MCIKNASIIFFLKIRGFLIVELSDNISDYTCQII